VATKKKRTTFANATFDARPDRLDFRDLQYRPPLRSLAPRWPGDDLVAQFLPSYVAAGMILDQGQEGACTGFGLACVVNYLLWTRHVQAGGDAPALVSERMLYELARRYDEWRGENYEGSSCRGALKGWHKHGVCARALWPYRDSAGRVRLLRPADNWYVDAAGRPLGVYYRIDKRSVVDMQAAVQEIGAIYVSARAHDGWDNVQERPAPHSHADLPVIPPRSAKSRTGGHAFAIVGYNEIGFIIQNSWGKGWGASGFAVLPYADWIRHATDAWACALGVAQDQRLNAARLEALRWPSPSGRSLGFFDLSVKAPNNPPEDPWPIDREYKYAPYEPWSTAKAFEHTLVTGNDGIIEVTDLAAGVEGDVNRFMQRLVVDVPLAALSQMAQPRLMIYAHGGLNSRDESIARIRVLAPYFEANGVYPLFLTWRTGPVETVASILEDKLRSIFGIETEEQARAAGFFDDLKEARDRRVEEIAHVAVKGLWTEMRENAERGAVRGHGLDVLARKVAALRETLRTGHGKSLEVHLVGHSAGSILLGHLLGKLAAPAVKVSSCSVYAAACSVRFAVAKYLDEGKSILSPADIALHYLTDANEKRDFLAGGRNFHLYGKSLLYLVSRALDDARKMPLLGFERAVVQGFETNDDQWIASEHDAVRTWQKRFKGTLVPVKEPNIAVAANGKTAQATHGSFDNSVRVITQTIERITGSRPVKPIEWLDY
jgi:hypothetical protein